jgi:tetratricopeptide (TPR) repeat protein
MILLLLALQVAAGTDDRFDRCVALIAGDPAAARAAATQWRVEGGGWFARQCAGMAYTREANWPAAAAEFEAAARDAETGRDARASSYWAQSGNAWLAANEPAKARTALDASLASGGLTGLQRGEAQLDRARALVALGETGPARSDLDAALKSAGDDPLAWLLSATLARRTGDLSRARSDIAEALRRSPDDASVQLESGNIAALGGDEASARNAWSQAARAAPDSDVGRSAAAALKQFDAR